MSVRILKDTDSGYSCLYCSTTMWAFGGLFYRSEDPEAFLKWLDENHIPGKEDPRQYDDDSLGIKMGEWRVSVNNDKIRFVQSVLLSLSHPSLFAKSIRDGAKDDPAGCINMILSQAKDNRRLVSQIIGEDLLKKIEAL